MWAKRFLQVVMVTGVVLWTTGSSIAGNEASPASETIQNKQLLFFMNPNGRPCQMQDDIIQKMGTSLQNVATVKYIKTTNRADYPTFRAYGIRGLPSLIILDENGKESKRFTPGVQSAETIADALKKK